MGPASLSKLAGYPLAPSLQHSGDFFSDSQGNEAVGFFSQL